MAALIDQQIRLLQTRYPNEHLVSTGDFLDVVSLQALVLHGIIWRTRFLTLHPETTENAIWSCCRGYLSECTGNGSLTRNTTVSSAEEAIKV